MKFTTREPNAEVYRKCLWFFVKILTPRTRFQIIL